MVETYVSVKYTKLPVLVRYNAALCLFDDAVWGDGPLTQNKTELRRDLAPEIYRIAERVENLGREIVDRVSQEIDDLMMDQAAQIHQSAGVQQLYQTLEAASEPPAAQTTKWVSDCADTLDDPPRSYDAVARDLNSAAEIVEGLFTGLPAELCPPKVGASVILEQPKSPPVDLIHGRTDLKTTAVHCPDHIEQDHTGQIKLMLPVDLTEMNAFALVYVAAHEIGVHLFERIKATSRLSTPEGWSFCEGFVDQAVFLATQERLEQDDTRSRAYLDGVRDRHSSRPNEPQNANENPKGEWRRRINQGRGAFDGLLALAKAARDHYPAPLLGRTPLLWAQQVAMVLNLMDLSDLERKGLVAAFDTLSPREDVLEAELKLAQAGHPMAAKSKRLKALHLGRAVLEDPKSAALVRCFLAESR
ncbi:MAG: hypothetical protein AAFR93_03015 [Pseudomonadota bacterium]